MPKIFQAHEARQTEINIAWNANHDENLKREKKSGNTESWERFDDGIFAKTEYFAVVLSKGFREHLDADIVQWNLFDIAIMNAKYEATGVKLRHHLNDNGEIADNLNDLM